ncbi:alpha-N-acetylneuraminide alpha-2,8-sialyltransferase-like [Saccoglossus kowalevskii]|uniref:Alpha-N-acetylneuraminide alpha-2,8-sialyltransferase-like n=1 Tax=Saccoglossus kowalevskii TaxID=10224 RepID=A0ABM0MBI9_SACKO|nr:PREDICTED: alpha-N-acetylneuraminide alpha-2,8-sialyltransferase-like [Saccoglossus kowalevskii]
MIQLKVMSRGSARTTASRQIKSVDDRKRVCIKPSEKMKQKKSPCRTAWTCKAMAMLSYLLVFCAAVISYAHVYTIPTYTRNYLIKTRAALTSPKMDCKVLEATNHTSPSLPFVDEEIETGEKPMEKLPVIVKHNIRLRRVKKRRKQKKKKPTLQELQENLIHTVSELQEWHSNITRLREIRNNIIQDNGTSLLFTQENTAIGEKYYSTYFTREVVIDSAKRSLFPEVSPFSSSAPVKTCAIVGNSGILHNSNCGTEIDSHDMVIRSNLPPIKKYVKDAGKKTSITSLSPSVPIARSRPSRFLKALKEYSGYILWVPNSSRMHSTDIAFNVTRLIQEHTDLTVLHANAVHFDKVKKYWKLIKNMSTGIMLMSLGACFCDELHLYGFWPFEINSRGEPVSMHYTNDFSWSTFHHTHDYPSEFDLLIKLHSEGVLKLHVNSCNTDA